MPWATNGGRDGHDRVLEHHRADDLGFLVLHVIS